MTTAQQVNHDAPALAGVCEQFGIGADAQIDLLKGGTAGRAWRVRSGGDDFFLRLRGQRAAMSERVAFDRALRMHLIAQGVRTVEPLPTVSVPQTYAAMDDAGGVYELYPFVSGRAFDTTSANELENVARELARFHEASRSFVPPAGDRPEIAQFAWLGLCEETSSRLDDPALQVINLARLAERAEGTPEADAIRWAEARARRLVETNGGAAFDRQRQWVIHGDFTPANVLMDEWGGVAGIFDLDWALPDYPRVRDLGDALYFFTGRRPSLEFSDIWSLTAAVEFDAEKCRRFLAAYQSESALDEEERRSIPAAFEGRWLSIRLEGMKKVAPGDGLRFFDRGDVRVPVQWLDTHWDQVLAAVG